MTFIIFLAGNVLKTVFEKLVSDFFALTNGLSVHFRYLSIHFLLPLQPEQELSTLGLIDAAN